MKKIICLGLSSFLIAMTISNTIYAFGPYSESVKTIIPQQQDRAGDKIVYFVEKNNVRTGKFYSYLLDIGEDTSDARRKIKNTYASEWRNGEKLGYGAYVLKPGESMLVYSCFSWGKRRVNVEEYVSEKEIMRFIVEQKAKKGYQYKELKRIYNPKKKPPKKEPTVIDKKETIAIYNFFFGEENTKRMGEITKKDSEMAQSLMSALLNSSCQMGYAETIMKVGLNPSSTATGAIARIMGHHLTKDCGTNIKNAKISRTVLLDMRRNLKSAIEVRRNSGEW